MSSDAYLLGHHQREWDRLQEQHDLWGPVLLSDLAALGLGSGSRVAEVGCGPGALLADLATAVGPTGSVLGVERDSTAASRARITAPRATVITADLHGGVPGGLHDLVIARWVLSFLPDPAAALQIMAAGCAPGGHIVIHDYIHDSLGLYPRSDAFQAVISAFRQTYRQNGGDLWVAGDVPRHLKALGLEDVQMTPHVQSGPPGSPVFRWVGRFLHEHLHTVIENGLLSPSQAQQFRQDWTLALQTPGAWLVSPLQVTVSARIPNTG